MKQTSLTVVEGTAPAFEYQPAQVVATVIFNKVKNGRIIGQVGKEAISVFQDPDADLPWGASLEGLIEQVRSMLTEEQP